jgi:hypothetical protein
MSTTRNRWLPAAQSAGWFQLNRHDDPDPADPEPASDPAVDPADPEPEPDPVDDPAAPEPDPEPDDANALGEAGKKALDRMKAERAAAKKEAAEAKKQAAALAKKVAEFEDRDKSESEKLAAQAERSAKQAAKAIARAVAAEVKAAAGEFADPADAVDVLMRDPSQYVDADGEIDTDAIETALSDLLERKPHWAKPEPAAPAAEKKPQIKPDPGQGSRGAPAPVNYLEAPKDQVAAELAKYGYRQRV